jgi:hypothetical protein
MKISKHYLRILSENYEDDSLPGFCSVYSGRNSPTFQRFLLPPSQGITLMETGSTSKTSANIYHNTRRNNPEDSPSFSTLLEPEISENFSS